MKKRTFRHRLRSRALRLWRSRMHILVRSLVWAVALSVAALLVCRSMVYLKLLGAELVVFVLVLVRGWLEERREERRAKRGEVPTAWWVN